MRRYKPTYFISQAFKGMWRNRMMTVASVIVLLSCLIVMGCFSMLLININKNLESIGNMNEIVVFVYSDAPYKEGSVRTLPRGPECEGNTFLGWSTDPAASEPQYQPGDKYTVNPTDAVAGEIRFYAVWEHKQSSDKLNVVYNFNGVELLEKPTADEKKYSVGDTVTLLDTPAIKNPTLSFMGWSLTPDGSSGAITSGSYVIGEDDVKNGTVTFYAIWSTMPEFDEFTIVYDVNGVDAEMQTDAQLKLSHVQAQLSLLDNVAEDGVSFISKEETLQDQKDKYKDYPGLQSFLSEENNPFPDTFVVAYTDNSQVDALELQIKNIEGVDKVRCRADIAKTIENLKSGVIVIFSWFMVILFVVSIFVIINTIKLAVTNRSKEIDIMRYIGATKWFIALPFQLEGAIIGAFSGIVAFLLQWYAYGYVQKMVMDDLNMIEIVPFPQIGLFVFLGCVIVGVLTGLLGSVISIRKHLREKPLKA